ncbi:ABC transporter ATP-binding protein [bacterium]|nr:MAG: ABC transporter ATP-binding protein [bacterium]
MLTLKNITKDYVNGDVVTSALKDVSFNIKEGELVAIMGPSGSGKSTLMHIIGLLDKATSGGYALDKIETSSMDEDKLAHLRNQKIGFVFQSFNLLPRISALENVELPLAYNSTAPKDRTKIARQILASVGLSHRYNHSSNQLSGGEKQRVAIARALVNDPAIILADEPTGNLDSKSGKQVMEILQKLNNEGKTVILVTHEEYTSKHADRIIKLLDGKVVMDVKVEERIDASKEDVLQK